MKTQIMKVTTIFFMRKPLSLVSLIISNIVSMNSENLKDKWIFNPDSTGKAAWEVAGLFFIIY
jgi:hypothetical protein